MLVLRDFPLSWASVSCCQPAASSLPSSCSSRHCPDKAPQTQGKPKRRANVPWGAESCCGPQLAAGLSPRQAAVATCWVTQTALQHVPPSLGHAGEAPGCFLPEQRFGETFAKGLLGSRASSDEDKRPRSSSRREEQSHWI